MRGIAILLVVAYHAGVPGFAGGYVGVDVFFVLSGYLITWLLVREIEGTGRVDLKEFYARRVRRLLPALALMLAVVIPATYMLYSPLEQETLPATALATAAYVSNLHFGRLSTDYLGLGGDANPLLHTWSLSVEEQFYLVWPVILLLGLGIRTGRSWPGARARLVLVLACCALLSLGLSAWLTGIRQSWAFFLSPTRAWEFAVGGLAVLLWAPSDTGAAGGAPSRIPTAAWGWFGLAGILAAAVAFDDSTAFPGVAALLPTLATVAVLVSGSRAPGGPAGVLGLRPLQEAGRLSYSWYLWHWPVLVLATAVWGELAPGGTLAAVLFALLLAEASYRLVENPIRRSALLARRPGSSLALGAGLTAAGIAAAILWGAAASRAADAPSQRPIAMAKAARSAVDTENCIARLHDDALRECAYGDPDARTTLLLFGDSHAAQWFTAFRNLADENGWRLVTLIKSACPPADVEFVYPRLGRAYRECGIWRDRALERIDALRPTVVVSASSHTYAVSFGGAPMVPPDDWARGTAETFRRLARAADHVVHLRDTPRPGFDVPGCLSRAAWTRRWLQARPCTFDRDPSLGQEVYGLELQAIAGIEGVSSLDLTQHICPEALCQPLLETVLVYRDTNHLAEGFASGLTPVLARRLAPVLGLAMAP